MAEEEWNAVDRISGLPRNVMDCILECMSIRDAVRTSILSRKWRYIWTDYPCIVLDKKFSKEIMRRRSTTEFQNDYIKIVHRILLQHLGPILKFVIDISNVSSTGFSDMDVWMLFLSTKGVRELTIDNSSANHYRIPSSIFSCPELTYLNISNCILKAPNDLQVFHKLKKLILQQIMLEPSVMSTPLLVSLKLRKCHGIRGFHIYAPQLKRLTLADNDYLELSYYTKICKNITYTYISLGNEVQHQGQGERITLKELLGCWPRLWKLCLDGFSLKYLAAGTVPERLRTKLNHLQRLYVFDINFDLDQIAWILHLLKSSPNLHNFVIQVSSVVSNDMKVLNYLEEQGRMKKSFNTLRILKVKHFKGTGAELRFVKLFLGFSSSLEQIFVEEDEKLDPCERLRMSKELMRFSRASPKAEIFFQPQKI